MKALDKMIKARAGLVLDMPFFGALSLRLTLKEDPTCKTAWVDGRTLGFNPKSIDSLTLTTTKGLVAHEVMHCAMGHQFRRGNRDPKKWNEAGDYAINGILEKSKVTLPEGRLFDPTFDGLSSEAIYPRLPEPSKQEGGDKKDKGDGSNEQGDDPGQCGEVRDAVDKEGNKASPAEIAKQEAEWKIATSQAAQQAKAMGQMPVGLDRMVKEYIDAKVDWRETLRRFVNTAAKNDYRWNPPNRRHIHAGLYLPSLHSEELKPIAGAIDTSGSITNEALTQVAGEITSILEEYDTTFHAIYVDSKVQGIESFTRDNLPVKLHAIGGGGTSFKPPFKWVDDNNIEPSCMIYLTDMEGVFPTEEPAYPVLWINFGNNDIVAPFGETVKI
jgi:predicted metal-dependent peptidase